MSRGFQPNRRGIQALLRTPEAGRAVRQAAERMAASADGDFRTDSALGSRRWRAAVIGDYSKHRAGDKTRARLLRALGGGR